MDHLSYEELREELEKARAELRAAREHIAAMEMSRFWKLRNLWWKLRSRFEPLRKRWAAPAADGQPGRRAWLLADKRPWKPPALVEPVDVFVLCPPGDAASRAALDSAFRRSRPPARVVAVSDREELVRAAAASDAQWVALVDAPVDLPEDWLERLVAALDSRPRALAAAALSRATPGMEAAWDRARAAFSTFEDFARRVAAESGRLGPSVGAVPPGVLLFRRRALAVAQNQASAHGLAGALEHRGSILLADDVVVDVQGRGSAGPAPSCRVFAGVASRLASLGDAERARIAGARYEGKRVLFVLPVVDRGGGANIVLREGRAMSEMGVDARVVNLSDFEHDFRRNYPDPEIPVTFANPGEIPALARDYDAVVATANTSVEWLAPLAGAPGAPVLGYYVQDFEPYFYAPGSSERARALASYTLLPGMALFAKTDWNSRRVAEECGVPCAAVGPSFETSLFRPAAPRPAAPPLRIAAMTRPSSPRRQPALTLKILEETWKRYGQGVEILLFGETRHPDGRLVEAPFPYRHFGVLDAPSLSRLFNDIHVFCDFSSYQAMGLTAMEAMACGAAVIVPREGGASSFASDGCNALFVDTSRPEPGLSALRRLVEEPELAARLGDRALRDVAAFIPEKPALRILEVLFGGA